ncbi:DNA/RNA non-specific endonuclease [Rhizobacter sp. J219]|uniref:DNA/RNA non-specific endonuclease n=1 Tax=Rhizobacter sp. J219 TaxID=2898430 RepID=UPI002150F77D|nr:DNA/RNA non-specific endonuclease [Rhizobacter sp. J219]MCR5885378.1 DNA/RNA non-specific endonuclease [Rhizobacter sp. J219]
MTTSTPQSWRPLDPDYRNRRGYDADFLDVAVPLPSLAPTVQHLATLPPLPYQHFSILLNPARRLAFWSAVNIDGRQERHLGQRQPDEWWFDERQGFTPRITAALQIGDGFYRGSGFQRGHLVRRLDPAWGETDVQSGRGEADTFHWTNCSPQMPELNTGWWLQVEDHLLQTANAQDHKVSVFSGCVFGDGDPLYRGVQIPLAFWKVAAWTVATPGEPALRSLAFLVKQDEAVAALLRKRGVTPQARDFDEVPQSIQGYQTTVAELSRLTHCGFGDLARADVDVYARRRPTRLAPLVFDTIGTYRALASPADLFTQ